MVIDRLAYHYWNHPILKWAGIYTWNVLGMALLWRLAFHPDPFRVNMAVGVVFFMLITGVIILFERYRWRNV